jgi:hypothetical protein
MSSRAESLDTALPFCIQVEEELMQSVKEDKTRPLFGVSGEVCSEKAQKDQKKLKKSLTESALLEMSGYSYRSATKGSTRIALRAGI